MGSWRRFSQRGAHRVFQIFGAERHVDQLAIEKERRRSAQRQLLAGAAMLLHALQVVAVAHLGTEPPHVEFDQRRVARQSAEFEVLRVGEQGGCISQNLPCAAAASAASAASSAWGWTSIIGK